MKEKWPDLHTSNGIEYGSPAHPSFYGFTRTYRFDDSEEKYRLVPGSARYTDKSSQKLGIDPDNPPTCPEVGSSPPFLVESEGGEEIETGSEVSVKPASKDTYTVSWKGSLNKDNKSDITLSENIEDEKITNKLAYVGCGGFTLKFAMYTFRV